jgi:hypothetical protein
MGSLAQEVIPIDGKTLRSSYDRNQGVRVSGKWRLIHLYVNKRRIWAENFGRVRTIQDCDSL